MTTFHQQTAKEILKTHGLQRIADQLCTEKGLKTMEDIGRLTDADIDALEWLKKQQSVKLKALCEACRQGDPDKMEEISDDRLRDTVPGKLFELDDVIADLRYNTSRTKQLEEQRKMLMGIKSRVYDLEVYTQDTKYSGIAGMLTGVYKLFPPGKDLYRRIDLDKYLPQEIEVKLGDILQKCTNFVQDEDLKHIESEIKNILTDLQNLREANRPVSAEYFEALNVIEEPEQGVGIDILLERLIAVNGV